MLKKALVDAFRAVGIGLTTADKLDFYQNLDNSSLLYSSLPGEKRELIAPFLPFSKAQIAQDLFALAFAENSSTGFFVEFGATDGVSLSNTWLLEKKLGWEGILAEPAKTWHNALKSNRNCSIDTRCVAKKSGLKYQFLEVESSNDSSPELSSIEEFASNGDWASDIRLKNSNRYEVETISLNDLLDHYNAPREIEFLSLDTEGSELEILQAFDFSNHRIRSICVEHNYVKENRQKINTLLLREGYKQVLQKVSRWDDWYVLNNE